MNWSTYSKMTPAQRMEWNFRFKDNWYPLFKVIDINFVMQCIILSILLIHMGVYSLAEQVSELGLFFLKASIAATIIILLLNIKSKWEESRWLKERNLK